MRIPIGFQNGVEQKVWGRCGHNRVNALQTVVRAGSDFSDTICVIYRPICTIKTEDALEVFLGNPRTRIDLRRIY